MSGDGEEQEVGEEDKDTDLPVDLLFKPHIWKYAVGSDQKNEVVNIN